MPLNPKQLREVKLLVNQQPRSKLTRYEWAEKIILRGKPRGIKPHNVSKAKNLPQGGSYSLFRGSQEKNRSPRLLFVRPFGYCLTV